MVIPYSRVLGDAGFALVLLSASAFGASGYWILVRLFWLKSLRSADLIATVALCMITTAVSWMGAGILKSLGSVDVSDLLPTLAWWVAFSISLYWSEVRRTRENTMQTMGNDIRA